MVSSPRLRAASSRMLSLLDMLLTFFEVGYLQFGLWHFSVHWTRTRLVSQSSHRGSLSSLARSAPYPKYPSPSPRL